MTSIQVSVRVRPFNSREMKYQSKLIVAMSPQQGVTEVTQVRQGKLLTNEAPKKFTFDHAFWSHDPGATDFASQEFVYNALGKGVLDNALQGFNGCLFAYGQTGSGKTYTMLGAPSDPGIIPRLCEDLFSRTGPSLSVRVEVSFLEIYNEQVRDLLNPASVNKTLRVRQHPTLGVFVEGLRKISAKTREEVEQLIDDGMRVRSVAATAMNATSSRSHGIITLNLLINNGETELSSQLHLVDLAGSERATSTGATGDTLTEGASINKSLTTLGMCLSRLADVASAEGGKKGKSGAHVPYRDSQLTWLLHESLGGNSKTAMLANVSPADINFEETLSTLRFAQTTKKIKMNAVVNEDPQQKLIRELRAEIQKYRELLEQRRAGVAPKIRSSTAVDEADDAGSDSNVDDAEAQDTTALLERLQDDTEVMEQLLRTSEEQDAADAKAREEREAQMRAFEAEFGAVFVDASQPRLILLNDNVAQLCAGQETSVNLVYYLSPGGSSGMGASKQRSLSPGPAEYTIGTATGATVSLPYVNDGMAQTMLVISLDTARGTAEARNGSDSAENPVRHVWINGKTVAPGPAVPLSHGDRIIVGPFAFRLLMPAMAQLDDEEDFDRNPTSTAHVEALEAYARNELMVEQAVEAVDTWQEFNAGLAGGSLEGGDGSGSDTSRDVLADTTTEDFAGLATLRYELAEAEKQLCREYPVAPGGASRELEDFDLNAALEERNEQHRSRVEEVEAMKRKEEETDREIAELRAQLAQQQAAKEAAAAEAAAAEAAAAAAAAAAASSEPGASPATNGDGDAASPVSHASSSSNAKANWKRAVRTVSKAENLKRANPHTKFSAEERLSLAEEVRSYEALCMAIQSWQPGGPSDPLLAKEYQYSLSSPKLDDFRNHDSVLFEANIHKWRFKTGIFSRTGYHVVYCVILPFTLAYFEKAVPTQPARASLFYYGAAIKRLPGLFNGKHAVRIDPVVPRKPGKMGNDNCIVIAMDDPESADGLAALLRRHSLPEPNERVANALREASMDHVVHTVADPPAK